MTGRECPPLTLSRGQIEERLCAIERRHAVRILHACESGSRCWGFASRDSDYDVRFIYVRPCREYLSLDLVRDVIEEPVDALWDVNGWDLSKALRLLRKGNSALAEWLRSPIIYRKNEDFLRGMLDLADQYVDPWRLHQSYFGMAMNNAREELSGETVRLKKYLYILRPLLCCAWLREHDFQGLPPVVFRELLEQTVHADSPEARQMQALLEKKRDGMEKTRGPHIEVLDRLIAELIEQGRSCAARDRVPIDSSRLDDFFRQWIGFAC